MASGGDLTMTGPMFDGQAVAAVEDFATHVAEEVGHQGLQIVQKFLHGSLQHPTGHYMGALKVDKLGEDAIVTDGGIVYGPWLEGTSSRNNSTKFAGYASFRKAAQQLESKVEPIGEAALQPYLERMN